MAYAESLAVFVRFRNAHQQGHQDWLDHDSQLFNENWKFDRNGYALFKSRFPPLAA